MDIVIREFSGAEPRNCGFCFDVLATHEAYLKVKQAEATARCCSSPQCQEKAMGWIKEWSEDEFRQFYKPSRFDL